jgi:zinc/manganese transport system substrate-binding protein
MNKIILILLGLPWFAQAKIQVATTTTDLAALVKVVGGDQVEVFSMAKGTEDPHGVAAKPSFMVKLRSSDLVIAHGLELESAWLQPLIQGSRNTRLQTLELASQLEPLEIPTGNISRADGDVHPGGNPHFQLDPVRLGKAAVMISERLGQLSTANKDFFNKNAQVFQILMNDRLQNWKSRIQKSGIKEAVTYHKTFSYFCDRFEIKCVLQLEPKPGIPPTASHLISIIDQMKKRKIKVVLIENLYEDIVGKKIRISIPTAVIEKLPVSVDGEPGLATNQDLIERIVKALEEGSR